MLLSANVSAVGRLIMRSARMAMVRGRCLLTTLVHRKHRTTVSGSGNLGRLDVDLYLLTGTLILVIVDGVTDVGGEFALSVLSGLSTWSAERPSVPESCARIPRGGTHIREGCDRWVSLAGRGTRALSRVCQCIFRASPLHYNKLIRGKYFERLQVNVPVTLQYRGLAGKVQVSYLCQERPSDRTLRTTRYQYTRPLRLPGYPDEAAKWFANLAKLSRLRDESRSVARALHADNMYRDRGAGPGPSAETGQPRTGDSARSARRPFVASSLRRFFRLSAAFYRSLSYRCRATLHQ